MTRTPSKRMWSILLVSSLVLGLSGGVLAMGNMPMPADPAANAAAPAVAAPMAASPANPTSLSSLGLTAEQIAALDPLIEKAKKVEKTKQDDLAKLQADRQQAAGKSNADAKKIANLDKLIQIKQGEITVARGQAQIAFAKVVGDAKAKQVADFVFGAKPAAQAAVNHNQWLDQMSQTMDQMMQRLPELSQKNPDEALRLMSEMLKVMNQMTSMRGPGTGMMGPMNALPVPAPAPGTDGNAAGSMQMGGPGGGGMSMGMGMMQQEMNKMQQMMKMMPPMQMNNNGGNADPNANMGGMNMGADPAQNTMGAPDPNAGGMGGMMNMGQMMMGGKM